MDRIGGLYKMTVVEDALPMPPGMTATTATTSTTQQLEALKLSELLALHAAVADALRGRGAVRSFNNPTGDYGEQLFCRAFGWTQERRSSKGCDAQDAAGRRYEIKARRLSVNNPSRQLGALRALPDGSFHTLAAVLFFPDYSVMRAALIPHAVVLAGAGFIRHTNSWRFLLLDAVWSEPGVVDVTEALQAAARAWHAAPFNVGQAADVELVQAAKGSSVPGKLTQRDCMRQLLVKHGPYPDRVCRDYVTAENAGLVDRACRSRTPEQYAAALYADGMTKGWLR
jgi:hypothetical protein